MSIEQRQTPSAEQAAEIEQLHATIAQLQAELVEVEAWASRAVAAAQERTYWLDRWHLDLNKLMERRGAAEFRALLRALRTVYRLVNRLRLRLRA